MPKNPFSKKKRKPSGDNAAHGSSEAVAKKQTHTVVTQPTGDDTGPAQLHFEGGDGIGAIPSWYRSFHEPPKSSRKHFDRSKPTYRSCQFENQTEILQKSPKFVRNTLRQNSGSTNRGQGVDNSIVIQKLNLDLSADKQQLRRDLEHARATIRNQEEVIARLRRDSETLQEGLQHFSANASLEETVRNLQEDLKANMVAMSEHRLPTPIADALREESIENIRLNEKINVIKEKTDQIIKIVSDGKGHSEELLSEIKALNGVVTCGHTELSDQIKRQGEQTKETITYMQNLLGNLKKQSPSAIQEEIDPEMQSLCKRLITLVGTKVYEFAAALDIPIQKVAELCSDFQGRSDLTQMFLVIFAEASRSVELTISRIMRACHEVGINPFSDEPLSMSHIAALKKMATSIERNVYPSAIAIQMRRKGVFSSSEMDFILTPKSVHVQSQRLLDILPFLGVSGFKMFLESLHDIGSGYVADDLKDLITHCDRTEQVDAEGEDSDVVYRRPSRSDMYYRSIEKSHWHANVQVQLAEIRAMMQKKSLDREPEFV